MLQRKRLQTLMSVDDSMETVGHHPAPCPSPSPACLSGQGPGKNSSKQPRPPLPSGNGDPSSAVFCSDGHVWLFTLSNSFIEMKFRYTELTHLESAARWFRCIHRRARSPRSPRSPPGHCRRPKEKPHSLARPAKPPSPFILRQPPAHCFSVDVLLVTWTFHVHGVTQSVACDWLLPLAGCFQVHLPSGQYQSVIPFSC